MFLRTLGIIIHGWGKRVSVVVVMVLKFHGKIEG